MADERDIAIGVMQIAAAHGGLCTFRRAYQDIPSHGHLSPDNLAASATRPGEPMWHQLVRNIKSHDQAFGNFIADGYLEHVPGVGYRVTNAGKQFLNGAAAS
jgi:hypothetical protein